MFEFSYANGIVCIVVITIFKGDMKMLKLKLLCCGFCALWGLIGMALATEGLPAAKGINPCMQDGKYRAFDFWLGDWEVYGKLDKTGPLYGHNSITRAEQGCLIMEHWLSSKGSTGTSMNYYDGTIGQWVQRWVSTDGTVIDYAGGLIELAENKQAMQLVGKIYYASTKKQPQIRDFRGTWTPMDGGVVQQFFEESVDGGNTWKEWFNGFYFPVNKHKANRIEAGID